MAGLVDQMREKGLWFGDKPQQPAAPMGLGKKTPTPFTGSDVGLNIPDPTSSISPPAAIPSGDVAPVNAPNIAKQNVTGGLSPQTRSDIAKVGEQAIGISNTAPIQEPSPYYDETKTARGIVLTPKSKGPIGASAGGISAAKLDPMEEVNRRINDIVDTYMNHGVKAPEDRKMVTKLLEAQATGAYGLKGAEATAAASLASHKATVEQAAIGHGIDRDKLNFEVTKFAKTNDMKDPQNVLKLAASIAPKKTSKSYNGEGNEVTDIEPDVNAGLLLLQNMGYKLPAGLKVMPSLPPASQHKGKIIVSSAGVRMQSDGKNWNTIK